MNAAKAVLLALLSLSPAAGQESSQTSIADLQKEVGVWQQKIKEEEGRIAKTDGAVAGEVLSFRSYLQTEAAHKAQFAAQNDSLAQDISAAKARVDSLEKTLESLKASGFDADNQVEEARLALLAACNRLKEFYAALPPGNVRATSTALEFLQGELSSKTVTVSEALERLWQIEGSLEDAESSMETYLGAPPVAGMGGQVYHVRIGLAYLATVNEEGKTAYVWGRGSGEGSGWQPVTDLSMKAALRDAVWIRDRKVVPRIVDLPFHHPLTVQSVDQTGGENRGSGR
jgi:hypothetical protein